MIAGDNLGQMMRALVQPDEHEQYFITGVKDIESINNRALT